VIDQSFINSTVKIDHYNYKAVDKAGEVLSALPYTFPDFFRRINLIFMAAPFNKQVFKVSTWGNDIQSLIWVALTH